jgi:hypothetical protein
LQFLSKLLFSGISQKKTQQQSYGSLAKDKLGTSIFLVIDTITRK